MKSNKCLIALIGCAMFFFITSCDMNRAERAASRFMEEYEKEEPQDAEQRPAFFYQNLLEEFCRRYYNSSFNRTYHHNSLIVDGLSVSSANREDGVVKSWNMMVEGRHSFEGFLKNHNDSPFSAFVDEKGDNVFEITFTIKRYDIFGDQMDESEYATRTITYSE